MCVSVQFFLITSQRSPTAVRQKERRVRRSEMQEGRLCRGTGGKKDRPSTGMGRQRYTAKTEQLRGIK